MQDQLVYYDKEGKEIEIFFTADLAKKLRHKKERRERGKRAKPLGHNKPD